MHTTLVPTSRCPCVFLTWKFLFLTTKSCSWFLFFCIFDLEVLDLVLHRKILLLVLVNDIQVLVLVIDHKVMILVLVISYKSLSLTCKFLSLSFATKSCCWSLSVTYKSLSLSLAWKFLFLSLTTKSCSWSLPERTSPCPSLWPTSYCPCPWL